jgi:adenosylcobinamide-GDP ribazoletransferase
MNSFFLAWQFLTIVPLRRTGTEMDCRLFGRSMAYYPVIGFLLGALLWGAGWILSGIFPRPVADGMVILLLVVLTGAFHLDGLADTLDGMAFGKSKEKRLQIMKEHHIGAFGVVGLILILGCKYAAFHSLPAEWAPKALIVALILGRSSMVQVLHLSPYARAEGGLGAVFKENLGKGEAVLSAASALVFSLFFFRGWGILLWLAAICSSWAIAVYFQRRLGGVTGDILGGTNEVNEALTLVFLSGLFFTGARVS